jgi:SAM-dependent methyltransferase
MPERTNPLGFDPDKVSGAFNRQQIYLRRPIKDTWDNVYLQKQEQLPQETEPTTDELTEKHLMYYHAFRNLGFFDLPSHSHRPTILQAGVGHGKTLRTIVRETEGVQPIGLDISMLSLLKSRASGLDQVVQGDILALPFADNTIDGIFEVGVAEHLYTDDPFLGQIVDRQAIVESFQQLHRVLKPGGKVGFIQPSRHSTFTFIQKN